MWTCPRCGRSFARAEQSHFCRKPATVDEYIAAQDEEARRRLEEIRRILRETLPDCQEKIAWGMPTYRRDVNIIHFAAAKRHIGLYPGERAVEVFADRLADYPCSKGAIRLPDSRPLPLELIREIAAWCLIHAKEP